MGDIVQEGCFVHSSFSNEEELAGTGIDSLHMDLLVEIVCKVSHDDLEPLSNVSTRFREAVASARQMHFDYTTPVRTQAPRRLAVIVKPNESSERSGVFECRSPSKGPLTPNAPKQIGKCRKLLSSEVLKELTILLFPSDEPIMNGDATTYVDSDLHVG